MNDNEGLSFSIVIPVYNNCIELKQNLKALSPQIKQHPSGEVFVVDNGSTDNSKEVARDFSFVKYLTEIEFLGSPYSARNRGIELARGDVIILLDAKCIVSKNWLTSGLEDLDKLNADLIGGDIRFLFSDDPTASELYDSMTNIKMESSVKERGVAKGGNLFIRKKIFNEIGLFPEGLRSGGDVSWTKKATNSGYKLEFSRNAFVYYRARSFFPLVKKQWRVGKSQPAIWLEQGVSQKYMKRFISMFIPQNPKKIDALISENGEPWMKSYKIRLYFVSYSIKVVMFIANLYGEWKIKFK